MIRFPPPSGPETHAGAANSAPFSCRSLFTTQLREMVSCKFKITRSHRGPGGKLDRIDVGRLGLEPRGEQGLCRGRVVAILVGMMLHEV